MTAPCPAVAESLAMLNAQWVDSPDGRLVPLAPFSTSFGVALSANKMLRAHGWRYPNQVQIRSLRTMLQVEQTIPGGH